jgi:hypothetical protein
MKVVGSDPVTVTVSQHERERLPRRWPIATVSVLAVTTVLTVLQFPFPEVRLALWRDPHALAAGQWWRLVTPLFVQYDAVWRIVVVFAFIAGIGVLAERVFGHGRWLPGCCRRRGRAWPASACGGWPPWWQGSCSPRWPTCTARRCCSASAWAPCCCGATGATVLTMRGEQVRRGLRLP